MPALSLVFPTRRADVGCLRRVCAQQALRRNYKLSLPGALSLWLSSPSIQNVRHIPTVRYAPSPHFHFCSTSSLKSSLIRVRPRPERPRLSTRSVPPHRWRHNDTRGDGRGSPLPQDWAHGLPTAPVHLSPLQPHRGCRGPPAEKRLRRGRLARERQEPDQWSADRRLAQHLRLHGALLDERAKEFGEPTLYEEFCARDLDK